MGEWRKTVGACCFAANLAMKGDGFPARLPLEDRVRPVSQGSQPDPGCPHGDARDDHALSDSRERRRIWEDVRAG